MIYYCSSPTCGFLFERASEVEYCPNCDRSGIRHANEQEKAEYLNRVAFGKSDGD